MGRNLDMPGHAAPVRAAVQNRPSSGPLRWLLVALFWSAVLFAFTVALIPQPPELLGTSDKLQHAVAFAALAAMGAMAYPRLSLVVLLIGLGAFGALIEFAQMIPALHRHGDVADWVADIVAAAATLSAIHLWRKRRNG